MRGAAYLGRLVLVTTLTMWLAFTVVFFAIRLMPGDPAIAALGANASAEAVERLRERMGLNSPLLVQYGRYLAEVARGNLGDSLISNSAIAPQISRALPFTIELVVSGLVIGCLIGIPIGILSAMRPNGGMDYAARFVALTGLTIPDFVLGIGLLLLFGMTLGWFPTAGMGSLSSAGDRLMHLVLPAVTLGTVMAAFVMRVTRTSLLEVMHEDYVRTARAKGLSERSVVVRHGLRNALIPVVSVLGIYLGVLLGGTVLIETVFSRPGLGRLLVGAIRQRDYNLLQSGVLVFAGMVIVVNLLVDFLYGLIDPRIGHDR